MRVWVLEIYLQVFLETIDYKNVWKEDKGLMFWSFEEGYGVSLWNVIRNE